MHTYLFLVLIALNVITMRTSFAQVLTEMEICSAGLKSAMYVGAEISKNAFPTYKNSYHESDRVIHLFSSPNKKSDVDACFLDKGRIVWRNEKWTGGTNGRWRNEVKDEVLTYSIDGDFVSIKTTFSDRSSTDEIWSVKILRLAARGKDLKMDSVKNPREAPIFKNELLDSNSGNCSPKAKSAVMQLLKNHGMQCNSVSFCASMSAQNIRVTCNDNAFAYRIRNRGAGYFVEYD